MTDVQTMASGVSSGVAELQDSPNHRSTRMLENPTIPHARKRERGASPSSLTGQPRKLHRTSSNHDMNTDIEINEFVNNYKRDDTYFMDDGSCMLLVEDTLFNVHRTILSKDSSSFSTMFTLPQGNREAEGRTEANPIILTGDTPAQFRHFLWALYALPPELNAVNSPTADLTQLVDIARIANKYSFKTIETWALDAIHDYVNRKPCPILNAIPTPTTYTFSPNAAAAAAATSSAHQPDSSPESTAQLTRLVRLAQLCGHERLLSTMIALLKQLMNSSLQYAYLAMTLSDELDLRALRGAAYLEVMQKAVIVKKTANDPPQAPASPAIASVPVPGPEEGTVDDNGRLVVNREQQLRLLSGYYRLTRKWESLRTIPPHFDHSPSCGATWHQHGCTQSWLEFWKEKTRGDGVLSLGLADVLGRLKLVQKDYDRWGSATYMHSDCRMAARKSIIEAMRTIENALPDYFSDGHEDDE